MATYAVLYNDFNSAINSAIDFYVKIFQIPEEHATELQALQAQADIKRNLAPMINGYRVNYFNRNIGKPLNQINYSYIVKCCQRIYEILKPSDNLE